MLTVGVRYGLGRIINGDHDRTVGRLVEHKIVGVALMAPDERGAVKVVDEHVDGNHVSKLLH